MSDNINNLNKNQNGFTLPELAITITLFGIVSVTFFGLIINYFANITRNNTFIDMTVNSQNVLRATVEELRYGAGVRQTNSITDPNGPGGGWNTSNAAFVIIIASPAKNSAGEYIIDSLTSQPYTNELVYFKTGTTLYRRTLANPSASGNVSKTTCPAAASTPSCPADAKLADYVKDMVFTLYDQDDVATSNSTAARAVKIDLFMERDTFGNPLVVDNSIRVALRNNF